METRINECQTIAELVFERQMEIFQRIAEWRLENERLGFAPNLTDTWTPEQRERFLSDWQDNEFIAQINQGQKRSYEEMIDDKPQTGGGVDEMSDNETSDESNFFTVDSVKEVNVKKFKTTGMDYHIRFTNTFADLELSEFHNQLYEIFQRMLNEVIDGVAAHDQVRFVLHSSQLDILSRERLTTERVLAEFERVIQSNHEFHLNDSVDVNIIHVEMPHGGKGSKRSEINLEKHLIQKRSIVRIQNSDDLCLARALVVAKAESSSNCVSLLHVLPTIPAKGCGSTGKSRISK